MTVLPPSASTNLAFLTILHEPMGYIGGCLATNAWGRPLEFRLTGPVQPNKVQQILYGESLEPYLCAELIGKTLVDKTATPVRVVITDHPAALELRHHLDVPVALYIAVERNSFRSKPSNGMNSVLQPSANLDQPEMAASLSVQANLHCHRQFPGDVQPLRALAGQMPTFDWGEPFLRIKEAIAEARKLGVASRAA